MKAESTLDAASLTSAEQGVAKDMGLDASFERRVALVNRQIRQMGMGKFQWWLFCLSGAGWAVDNIIFEALAMTLPQWKLEFRPEHVQFATFALYIGLLIGAFFWGFGADVVGRRFAWNATLFIGSVFMIAVGAAPSFVGGAALLAAAGLGIGGNLPVDGAMLIEFLPGHRQWLLTLLSAFWCFGQVFAALIGWAFITNYRCDDANNCPRESNMGWRYTWFLVGGFSLLLWVLRFFIFPIPESPKFLLSKGRDAEAIAVLDHIARLNGTTNSLTLQHLVAAGQGSTVVQEQLTSVDEGADKKDDKEAIDSAALPKDAPDVEAYATLPSTRNQGTLHLLRTNASQFSWSNVSALFATRKMALNTTLICACWMLIGAGFPLYNAFVSLYIAASQGNLGQTSQSEQYRQLVIIAVCGIPGSIIAAGAVELPYAGRRGSMAFFTMVTGACLFGFTSARTPEAVLGWNCGASLAQNAMYGVLYAITYEVFPSNCRGTGDGLAMGLQRVAGITAPLIAAFGSESNPTAPVFVSASLFMAASIVMLFLPYEPRRFNAF